MSFKFASIKPISDEILHLQKRVNELTASLEPYKECEDRAGSLLMEAEKLGFEMVEKGIPLNDVILWAEQIYLSATKAGKDSIPQNKSEQAQISIAEHTTAAAATEVTPENQVTEKKESRENIEAKGEKTPTPASMVEVSSFDLILTPYPDKEAATNEAKTKISPESMRELTRLLAKGDIVQVPNGNVGTVKAFGFSGIVIQLLSGDAEFSRKEIRWISTPQKTEGLVIEPAKKADVESSVEPQENAQKENHKFQCTFTFHRKPPILHRHGPRHLLYQRSF